MEKSVADIWREVDEALKEKPNDIGKLYERLIACITHPETITDWHEYAHLDKFKHTRNLVHLDLKFPKSSDRCDPKSVINDDDECTISSLSSDVSHDGDFACNFTLNLPFQLVVMGWSPGQSSLIHDHAGSECCMRVLAGELLEERFDVFEGKTGKADDDLKADELQVKLTEKLKLLENQSSVISNRIGWHRISNAGPNPAFSIHLYYPPIGHYRVICPTRKKKIVVASCVFHSINGQIIKEF